MRPVFAAVSSTALHKKLQTTLVLLSWLLATGSQWDFVQVVGWSRMLAAYSQTMALTSAVELTLNGEMCSLCKAVSDAKKQEQAVPVALAFKGKIIALFQPAPVFVAAVMAVKGLPAPVASATGRLRSQPPTPPPRAA